MKMSSLFVVLLFLMAVAYPVSLDLTVKYVDSRSVSGATVEILGPTGVAYSGTIDRGVFSTDVSKGEYIIVIKRYGYADKITPVSIKEDTSLSLIMLQKSNPILYGHVESPTPMKTLVAAKDGIVSATANVFSNGLYVLPLLEAGDYELVLKDTTTYRMNVTVKETMNINITMPTGEEVTPPSGEGNQTSPPAEKQYSLTVAQTGAVGTPVLVRCYYDGGTADATVKLPAGNTIPITNNNFVPDAAGAYMVTCGDKTQAVAVQTSAAPVTPGKTTAGGIDLIGIAIVCAVIVVIVIIVYFVAAKKEKPKEEAAGKEAKPTKPEAGKPQATQRIVKRKGER